MDSIAKHCQCSIDTARESVSHLLAYNMVERTERPGLSPLYRLTHVSEWKSNLVGTIRSKRHVRSKKTPTPPEIGEGSLPPRKDTTPPEIGEGNPSGKRVGDPSGKRGDEVHPSKGIHSKGIQISLNGSFHREFIDGWMNRFRERFGCDYLFAGGKDGSAVKVLSRAGLKPDELLAIAEKAWSAEKQYISEVSRSIAGFASKFNEIRTSSVKAKPDFLL